MSDLSNKVPKPPRYVPHETSAKEACLRN